MNDTVYGMWLSHCRSAHHATVTSPSQLDRRHKLFGYLSSTNWNKRYYELFKWFRIFVCWILGQVIQEIVSNVLYLFHFHANGYLNRYFNTMVTFVQTLKKICHQKLTRAYAHCGRPYPTPINPIRIQNLCITIVFSPFNSIIKPFQHVGHLFQAPIKKWFNFMTLIRLVFGWSVEIRNSEWFSSFTSNFVGNHLKTELMIELSGEWVGESNLT